MSALKVICGGLAALALVGCVSAPAPIESQTTRIVVAQPVALPPPPPLASRPPPPVKAPPTEPVVEAPSAFASVEGWSTLNAEPAFAAFRESCRIWRGAEDADMLSPNLPQYGTFGDWRPSCRAADQTGKTATQARAFFETHFAPVELSTPDDETGLLTGYYEPELTVRRTPDAEFSEPVLAKPKTDRLRLQERAKINSSTARVIAYGRPIDVFFMQIQGSGRIKFTDDEEGGLTVRAAFAGHNGQPYSSIGRKLIAWGEIEKGKASKGNIEAWMENAGRARTTELMNTNKRYIFFEEQAIPVRADGSQAGPRGAMRVPLTDMGSIALDPRYHPYGTLAVLETTLPQAPRDFRGKPETLLVVGQDTGGAIKGPLRGDLFFGPGKAAGDLAGVMKHPVRWTLLLPKAIAGTPPAS